MTLPWPFIPPTQDQGIVEQSILCVDVVDQPEREQVDPVSLCSFIRLNGVIELGQLKSHSSVYLSRRLFTIKYLAHL